MTTSKVFLATIAELPSILSWVLSQLNRTSLSDSEKMRLELAMEEAIVNVIQYAKAKELTLTVRIDPKREIAFELSDAGVPFNPLQQPLPVQEVETTIEELALGGKGLTFMRKCTDALLYRREENRNILTLVKKII